MSNYQITTDELDFDLVKANIKSFLKGQEVYSDYDFEGSALSVLIDLLAYNTLYGSFYNHLAINEMFLDSASKISSAISLSKSIGYTPRSTTAASALLTVSIRSVVENPTTLTLPSGTVFRATIGNREFNFVTTTDYTASNNQGVFTYENVKVVEGKRLTKRYIASSNIKFVVPNDKVDTTSIQVTIQENNGSSVYTRFNKVNDILQVSANDEVFFLKQREDSLYEVYFGNGTLGKALSVGNVVILDYIVSNGSAANGARSFVYTSGFRSDVLYSVTTEQIAIGGSEPETLESIKFNAPRMYVTQNRAVTSNDYDVLLKQAFPNIESLNVWGGQDHVPPVYGKVFVVAKPTGRETFLEDEKSAMASYLLNGTNVATLTPVIMDPEYLRLQIVSNVYYNKNLARKSSGEIGSVVRQNILSYNQAINQFGNSFRFSRLESMIDNSDSSIISNITTIRIRKTVNPIYNINSKYTIRLENPIYQDKDTGDTVWSTRFFVGEEDDRCYFKDDGKGNIDLYLENVQGIPRFYRTIGTVNYSTGVIQVTDLLIRGLYDQEIEVMCTPYSNDIIPIRQYLINIPPELVTVNMIADVETSSGIKQKHIFSPSR